MRTEKFPVVAEGGQEKLDDGTQKTLRLKSFELLYVQTVCMFDCKSNFSSTGTNKPRTDAGGAFLTSGWIDSFFRPAASADRPLSSLTNMSSIFVLIGYNSDQTYIC